MPHLAVPRTGWENEHLATYLLSQIAFVAHPMTVADDVGSDFFCTLFEPRGQGRKQMLFPLNTFAIQVKSRRRKVEATNKIEYLHGIELPFFLGVANRSGPRMSIYSGEYLPLMFSHLGLPRQLTLHLVNHSEVSAANAYDGAEGDSCNLRLPFVLELAAGDSRETISENAQKLSLLCSRMHRNISTWKLDEYIFKFDSGEEQIVAGCRSSQVFRHNFCLRLAEVFYNMKWLYNASRSEFSVAEFEMYERTYKDLLRGRSDVPPILSTVYRELAGLVRQGSKQAAE